MGSKSSHLQTKVEYHGGKLGQTRHISQVNLQNYSKPRDIPPIRSLAGDVDSSEDSLNLLKLNYEGCGDKINTEQAPDHQVDGGSIAKRFDEKLANFSSDESDTSSSISIGDGSIEVILQYSQYREEAEYAKMCFSNVLVFKYVLLLFT